MSPDPAEEITDDAALGGRLRLLQPRKGHRFGHDAILLAAAAPVRAGQHVVDLGAGVGAAGLAIAARVPGVRLTLVEIDPALAALAASNIARNGFAESAVAACLDITASADALASAGLAAGCADCVVINPPFYDPEQITPSPDQRRRVAHIGGRAVLAAWITAAHRLLRAGGVVTMIYRADGADEVHATLLPDFGGTVTLPILPKPNAPPIRVLISAVKGSHAPGRLLPGLDLNDLSGKATDEAESVLRHAAAINLGG